MPKQAEATTWTDTLCAAAILLLGGLLCLVGAGLLEHWQDSSAQRQELHAEDLLGAAAAAGGAILVGWWILSLLLAGATAVLDRGGKSALLRSRAGCRLRLCNGLYLLRCPSSWWPAHRRTRLRRFRDRNGLPHRTSFRPLRRVPETSPTRQPLPEAEPTGLWSFRRLKKL